MLLDMLQRWHTTKQKPQWRRKEVAPSEPAPVWHDKSAPSQSDSVTLLAGTRRALRIEQLHDRPSQPVGAVQSTGRYVIRDEAQHDRSVSRTSRSTVNVRGARLVRQHDMVGRVVGQHGLSPLCVCGDVSAAVVAAVLIA